MVGAAGSAWIVPPSRAWAMVSDAARSGDELAPPRPPAGGALRFSFGRSDIARNRTAMPNAVSAIAAP
jgi:hypothetical protein